MSSLIILQLVVDRKEGGFCYNVCPDHADGLSICPSVLFSTVSNIHLLLSQESGINNLIIAVHCHILSAGVISSITNR